MIPDVFLIVAFIVLGYIAGLTLYANESTKRRKAFQLKRFYANDFRPYHRSDRDQKAVDRNNR